MKLPNPPPPTFDDLSIALTTSPEPFSVQPLMFHGRAALNKKMARQITSHDDFKVQRVPLVIAIHEFLMAKKAAGSSDKTLTNYFYQLRSLFTFAESRGIDISLGTIRQAFIEFCDHLHVRSTIAKEISEKSAYALGSTVAGVINDILDQRTSLLFQTSLQRPAATPPWKRAQAASLDQEKVRFGRALYKLIQKLDLETLSAELPLSIDLEPGFSLKLDPRVHRDAIQRLPDGTADVEALRKQRSSLVNLRIEADFLGFISQTGLNLEQARTLRRHNFNFGPSKNNPDSIEVGRSYKARKGGQIDFEIYTAYKPIFLEYISFRDKFFTADEAGFLFEFLPVNGKTRPRYYSAGSVKRIFEANGFPYRGPQNLRTIRSNALLEKLDGNILIASEMSQHNKETFLKHYARPDFATLIREVAIYHETHAEKLTPPAPGACERVDPELIEGAATKAPRPDCRNPSGCFFCAMHRDVDSMDHAWSLVSYRHIKSIELSRYRGLNAENTHAYLVIERISKIVSAFSLSSTERSRWVAEAEERISEGWFHPSWENLVDFAETVL